MTGTAEVKGTLTRLAALFPWAAEDLSLLRWSHATNSEAQLRDALQDPDIHLVEADVMLCPEDQRPYMSHPPTLCKDLSLEKFMALFAAGCRGHVGLKLDFKSPAALKASLPLLTAFEVPILWINADVLGSSAAETSEYQAIFASLPQLLPSAHYSLGWNTADWTEGYNASSMSNMEDFVREAGLPPGRITLPLRVGLLSVSSLQTMPEAWCICLWESGTDDASRPGEKLGEVRLSASFRARCLCDLRSPALRRCLP